MLQSGWLKERLFSEDIEDLRGLSGCGVKTGRMLYLAWREFRADFCFERAASLTFATMVSLFPLSVLFVTVVSSLGGGGEIIGYVKREVVAYLAEDFKEPINNWLDRSMSEEAIKQWPTGLINLAASVFLFLSALAVLVTAERVFNRIWKVPGTRSYFQKLTAFWVILTTSPLMILASMSMGNLLVPEGGVIYQWKQDYPIVEVLYGLLVPIAVGFLAFTLVYVLLPSTRVRLGSAAAGAIIAALLWEASKQGFYLYIEGSGRATNFVRNVAAIPVFLLWLYVTWTVILCGGEISYVHQNLKLLSRNARREVQGRKYSLPFLGVYVLARVGEAFRAGKPAPTLAQIAEDLRLGEGMLADLARRLVQDGILMEDHNSPGRYGLSRHPSGVALGDVVRGLREREFSGEALGQEVFRDFDEGSSGSVDRRVGELFRQAAEESLRVFEDLTLEDLTAPGGALNRASSGPETGGESRRKAVDSTR